VRCEAGPAASDASDLLQEDLQKKASAKVQSMHTLNIPLEALDIKTHQLAERAPRFGPASARVKSGSRKKLAMRLPVPRQRRSSQSKLVVSHTEMCISNTERRITIVLLR
jgi:hypothetical protein